MSSSMQCTLNIDSAGLCAERTQHPSTSRSNMVPRRRKKARRSCLNCQRGHKTCENKRPCEECIRRGIPITCVDGYRKPPKYLRHYASERITADLHHTVPSLQVTGRHEKNDFDVAHYRKETPLKAEVHVRKENPLGGGLPEFIDPSLLHILEGPHQTPEDKSGDVPAEQLKPEGLETQYTGVNRYGGHRIKNRQGSGPSYGFAISSGWGEIQGLRSDIFEERRLGKIGCSSDYV